MIPDKTFLREGEAMAFLGFTRKQWRNLRWVMKDEDARLRRLPKQCFAVILPGYTYAHFRTAQLRAIKDELEGKVKV